MGIIGVSFRHVGAQLARWRCKRRSGLQALTLHPGAPPRPVASEGALVDKYRKRSFVGAVGAVADVRGVRGRVRHRETPVAGGRRSPMTCRCVRPQARTDKTSTWRAARRVRSTGCRASSG